jgi:hypothetical protein
MKAIVTGVGNLKNASFKTDTNFKGSGDTSITVATGATTTTNQLAAALNYVIAELNK